METLVKMEQDLKNLWLDMQSEKSDICREKKRKKYWLMYSSYRRQKSFLKVMGQ